MPSMNGTCVSPLNSGKVFEKQGGRHILEIELTDEAICIDDTGSDAAFVSGTDSVSIHHGAARALRYFAAFSAVAEEYGSTLSLHMTKAALGDVGYSGPMPSNMTPGFYKVVVEQTHDFREIKFTKDGTTLAHVYLSEYPSIKAGSRYLIDGIDFVAIESFTWLSEINLASQPHDVKGWPISQSGETVGAFMRRLKQLRLDRVSYRMRMARLEEGCDHENRLVVHRDGKMAPEGGIPDIKDMIETLVERNKIVVINDRRAKELRVGESVYSVSG